TVVITSVAPLRDLAPGSVADMIAELSAWSGRCDGVLADLEQEIAKVKASAKRRHAREVKAEKQRAAAEGGEKSGLSGILNESKGGRTLRGLAKKGDEEIEYEDAMELDGGSGAGGLGGGGKKRSAGGGSGMSGALAGMMGKSSGNGGR
ncbi:hypothetical protein LTR57_023758, partial [Friedmanniomyces endolithicus]